MKNNMLFLSIILLNVAALFASQPKKVLRPSSAETQRLNKKLNPPLSTVEIPGQSLTVRVASATASPNITQPLANNASFAVALSADNKTFAENTQPLQPSATSSGAKPPLNSNPISSANDKKMVAEAVISKAASAASTVASINSEDSKKAAEKTTALSSVSTAATVAAAISAQNNTKLEPKRVSKLVKFGPFGKRVCEFELPISFDENDEETVSTQSGKVPASLWRAIQFELKKGTIICSGEDCSISCDQKLKAEECVFTVLDLKPKMTTKWVSFGEPEQSDCSNCSFSAGSVTYDENDCNRIDVIEASHRHALKPYSSAKIPLSLWTALPRSLKCNSDHYKSNCNTFNTQDSRCAQYYRFSIYDPSTSSTNSPLFKNGNKWTIFTFSSAFQNTPCKSGTGKCKFAEETDTDLDRDDTKTNNEIAKKVALRNIQSCKAKCKNSGCNNTSGVLSHSKDILDVELIFPSSIGGA